MRGANFPSKRLLAVLAVVAGTALVGGCGQSGALYLPSSKPQPTQKAAPPQTHPAPAPATGTDA